jgi:hypothetical protein
MRTWTPIAAFGLLIILAALGISHTGEAAFADDKTVNADSPKRPGQTAVVSKVFRIKQGNLEAVETQIRTFLQPEVQAAMQVLPNAPGGGNGIAGGGIGGGLNGALGALGLGGGIGGMFGLQGGAFGVQPGTQLGIHGGIGGGIAGIQGTQIGGGIAGIQGAHPGGALGAFGFSGMQTALGHPPIAPTNKWRLVADERTSSLIFRGSPEDAQTVGELVALANLEPGAPLPPLKRLSAFQLKHAQAGPLVEKLNQLELDARIGALEASNTIVVFGSESAKKEIAELIKALDVEVNEM